MGIGKFALVAALAGLAIAASKAKAEIIIAVLGKIGFDMKGDVTAPGYVFYEWKNGTYDYYAK
ncbi:MAG: hypothetical protein IID53_03730 [Proteobacteria bacterium]|nr:hypothetical protein [Pseudomonadota bacterium]